MTTPSLPGAQPPRADPQQRATPSSAPARLRAAASIVLLCLFAFIPGLFTLPVIDRDEARFAQASRQMFESVALPIAQRNPDKHSGGLLIPMVQDRPRLNKPPMIYWLQSASAAAFTAARPASDAIWMYRIPSLLAAIAAVLLTWRLGASMFGSRVGRLAAISLAVAPVIAWEAHQARADMVLLAITMLAITALWHIWRPSLHQDALHQDAQRAAWRWPITLWLAIAAGILTKGPITPMVIVLACLVLTLATRRVAWLITLRPALGLAILIATVAPWVYGVASQVGFDRYLTIIHDEVLGRSLEPKEGHWGPPGYHIVLLPVILWPAAMLAGAGLVLALTHALSTNPALKPPAPEPTTRLARFLARWRSLRTADPALLFCLAWIAPSWIVFELVSTKLPHYTMPLLPGVAILGALACVRADRGQLDDARTTLTRLGLGLWLAIGLAITLAVALLGVWFLRTADRSTLAIAATSTVTLLGVATALVLLWRARAALRAGRFELAQTAAVFLMLPLLLPLMHALLPAAMGLSANLAAQWRTHDPHATRPLAMVEYHEDSMLFHSRGRIRRLDPDALPRWWDENPRALVLMRAALAREDPSLTILSTTSGFNYSTGRAETLVWTERDR